MTEKTAEKAPEKLHFFMCTGQVAFYPGNITEGQTIDPAMVQILVSNTVLFTRDGTIKVRDIANVQQSLQMNVLNRYKDGQEPPAFLDCVLTGIFPLGVMTEEEFEANSPMAAIRQQKAEAQAVQEAELLKSMGMMPS